MTGEKQDEDDDDDDVDDEDMFMMVMVMLLPVMVMADKDDGDDDVQEDDTNALASSCRLSLIAAYDPKASRAMRTAIVTTGLVTILFTNAVLNAQLNPAPEQCTALTTESDCLAVRSAIQPAVSACAYDQVQ
jgi:hypothetical protein